jgi:hypothetical protein
LTAQQFGNAAVHFGQNWRASLEAGGHAIENSLDIHGRHTAHAVQVMSQGIQDVGEQHCRGVVSLAENASEAAEIHGRHTATAAQHVSQALSHVGENHHRGAKAVSEGVNAGLQASGEALAEGAEAHAAGFIELARGISNLGLFVAAGIAIVGLALLVQGALEIGTDYVIIALCLGWCIGLTLCVVVFYLSHSNPKYSSLWNLLSGTQ